MQSWSYSQLKTIHRHYILLSVSLSQRSETFQLLKVAGILWFVVLHAIIWSLKHTFNLHLTCLGWETRQSSKKVKVTYFHCIKPSAVTLHHCSISSDCSLLCSLTTICFWVYVMVVKKDSRIPPTFVNPSKRVKRLNDQGWLLSSRWLSVGIRADLYEVTEIQYPW